LLELQQALNELDSKTRGLIITGSGEKAFIAGADIKAMSAMDAEQGKTFSALGQQLTLQIENLPFPVIAAVNGFALGGGCEIALSADFIYASNNAIFGLPETKLGLIPGFGGTQRLAKIVGRNLAKEMIYTAKNLSASEAKEHGLVLQIAASREELLEICNKTLEKALSNSGDAIHQAKLAINRGCDLTVEQGLEIENQCFEDIFSSPEKQEGVNAFLEKRKANF